MVIIKLAFILFFVCCFMADSNCLHVNSGGKDVAIKEDKTTVLYEGDGDIEGGTANYFIRDNSYWGFSSTGDFMDDHNYQNTRYTVSLSSSNISDLYATARVSPISLTYFHHCLENGNYTVNLHFAEILFTNDRTYNSLGKRIFDIYIQVIVTLMENVYLLSFRGTSNQTILPQERLVVKDFNIEDYSGIAQKPLVKRVSNVSVSNNSLEIRFYWAGKGTTRIPSRGVYGPLISAVSVVSGELLVPIFLGCCMPTKMCVIDVDSEVIRTRDMLHVYEFILWFPLSTT